MSIGRNEPCPCKSGKKFKKCCIDARATGGGDLGPCARCGAPASAKTQCQLCHKGYAYCPKHRQTIQTSMRGHILRVHPESLPSSTIDKILDSPTELAVIRGQAAREPSLWANLARHLENRKSQRA